MYLMLEIKYEFDWNGLSVYTVNGKLENQIGIIFKYENAKVVSALKPCEMRKFDVEEINRGRISNGVYNLIKNSIK